MECIPCNAIQCPAIVLLDLPTKKTPKWSLVVNVPAMALVYRKTTTVSILRKQKHVGSAFTPLIPALTSELEPVWSYVPPPTVMKICGKLEYVTCVWSHCNDQTSPVTINNIYIYISRISSVFLIWMSQYTFDSKAGLVPWYSQAVNYYLRQYWPTPMSPYSVSRPQLINCLLMSLHRPVHCSFRL